MLQFSLQAASSGVLALLRGERTRVLDPERLPVKDSREWGLVLDTFQSTKGLTSSQDDCYRALMSRLLPFKKVPVSTSHRDDLVSMVLQQTLG